MSLPNYLANIKSAGCYRYVFDKSIVPESEKESIRLVVGYSEKGPFNTPVYIEANCEQDFINLFGGISRRLERKGIFFHRLALQSLSHGPILALNLKPFNMRSGAPEKADVLGFNANELADQSIHPNQAVQIAPVTKQGRDMALDTIYDTNRFWHVDPERLHNIKLRGAALGQRDLIRIARVSDAKDDTTIFMRPFVPSNYNIKVSDWYSSFNTEMPAYMEYLKDHYLNEFFVEIYVFKGNLQYKSLFDYNGTLGSQMPCKFDYALDNEGMPLYYDEAMTRPVLKNIWSYKDSVYQSFPVNEIMRFEGDTVKAGYEKLFHNQSGTYGAKLQDIDTAGSWYNFMKISSGDCAKPSTENERQLSWVPFCVFDEGGFLVANPAYMNASGELDDPLAAMADVDTSNFLYSYTGSTIPGFKDGNGSFISIDAVFNTDSNNHGMLMHIDESLLDEAADLDSDMSGYYSAKDEYVEDGKVNALAPTGGAHTHANKIYEGQTDNHYPSPAAYLVTLMSGSVEHHVASGAAYLAAFDKLTTVIDVATTTLNNAMATAAATKNAADTDAEAAYKAVIDATDSTASQKKVAKETYEQALKKNKLAYDTAVLNANNEFANASNEAKDTYNAAIATERASVVASNQAAMVGKENTLTTAQANLEAAITKVVKAEKENNGGLAAAVTEVNEAIAALNKATLDYKNSLSATDLGNERDDYRDKPITRAHRGILMHGYIYNSILRNMTGIELQSTIMTAANYKGLKQALSNNTDIDYHYFIDTFQTYPGISMKSILTQITKAKDNAVLLTSFPTMESVMRHCGHPAYIGGFDMKEVIKSSNGISLPTATQGASWAGFYTQIKMTDGSATFTVPATALVGNKFMEKLEKRHMYDIVAGPNHGLLKGNGVVGPDYPFARPDKDVLENMGVNVITIVPGYGTVIDGNQTAKQTPKTALSKLHIRELTIFIQDEIEKMLRGYQWELNTPELRANISAKAETIMGLVEANGGVYKYTVKCDDENNTPEVIDNELVILDIEIEPSRGSEKMVQTLTIHRTGGIKSVE